MEVERRAPTPKNLRTLDRDVQTLDEILEISQVILEQLLRSLVFCLEGGSIPGHQKFGSGVRTYSVTDSPKSIRVWERINDSGHPGDFL